MLSLVVWIWLDNPIYYLFITFYFDDYFTGRIPFSSYRMYQMHSEIWNNIELLFYILINVIVIYSKLKVFTTQFIEGLHNYVFNLTNATMYFDKIDILKL